MAGGALAAYCRRMHTRPSPLAALARLLGVGTIAVLMAGCTLVPNMDHGTSGCANARGIGPRDGAVPQGAKAVAVPPVQAMPDADGLSPMAAAELAAGRGHTVVFNVQIPSYGECWCVPPPEGTVVDSLWNANGALVLMVEGADEGHTPAEQPASGWGCA